MSERAKIFTNGGSQAVRLPKSVRFPSSQREVIARRSGRRVILEAARPFTRAGRGINKERLASRADP